MKLLEYYNNRMQMIKKANKAQYIEIDRVVNAVFNNEIR